MPLESVLDELYGPVLRRRPRSTAGSFTPEQQASLMGRLASSAGSGISKVGNLLDLPGSMVRDVLTANNPFDQLLSPLSDENRVTGRDLLRSYGVAGRRDSWGNFGGGLGAEILLDPLTYMTFGASALSKAGKAAKVSGTLQKGLQKQIAAGQRGLVGFRIPGVMADPARIGTGAFSQAVAGGVDRGAEAVRYSEPGRALASLFDARLKGTMSKQGQQLAQEISKRTDAADASTREFVGRQAIRLKEAGLTDSESSRALRRALEGVSKSGDPQFATEMLSEHKNAMDDLLDRAQSLGMEREALDDSAGIAAVFRRLTTTGTEPVQGSRRAFATTDPSGLARRWYLKGLKGGTDDIIEIATDTDVEELITSGAKWTDVRDLIDSRYGAQFPDSQVVDGVTHNRETQIGEVAKSLMGMPPEVRQSGVFGNHTLADVASGMGAAQHAIANTEGILDFLPSVVKDVAGSTADVPLQDLLGKMKLGRNDFADVTARLGIGDIKNKFVSREMADDIMRLHEGFKSPEAASWLVRQLDNATNLFKTGVTGVWAAFHSRNLFGGQFANWVAKSFSTKSVRMAHQIMRGEKPKGLGKIFGTTDEEAVKRIGELAYSHRVLGRYEGQSMSLSGSGSDAAGRTLEDILAEIPGQVAVDNPISPATAGKFFGVAEGTTVNPLKAQVRGVAGRESSTFGPAKAGEDVGHYVEGLNRLAPFIELLRQGMDPAEAAAKVGATQVQYANRYYTPFQQQVLARMFPFYKFSGSMLPYHLKMLADQPGGRAAQTIRAMNRGRSQDEVTPDYVAETASVRLGATPSGSNRYLTGFGLMIEDPLSFFSGPKAAGLELLSRINPIAKAPFEMATGQSFFQRGPGGGREIESLDPPIGRTIANVQQLLGGEPTRRAQPFLGSRNLEFILSNMPTSRAVTTMRTATDPRKWESPSGLAALFANLGTGVRISDVSPAAQDAILRERATELMKALGSRTFSKTYIPDDQIEALSPKQQEQALMLQALQQELVRRAKQRKLSQN